MGRRIFLSYQREDHAEATRLGNELRLLGHDVWIDQEGLRAGRRWWDQILQSLREVDVVVLAISPGYLEADACRAEWRYALALNRVVIPVEVVRVDTNHVPTEIGDIELVRVGGWGKLVAAIDGSVATPLPDPLPAAPNPPLSWAKVIEIVRSADDVDPDTQFAVAVKLIENMWSPPVGVPENVPALADEFLRREQLDTRARRLLRAASQALVPTRRTWYPVIGAALGGLALTHLFWVVGLYDVGSHVLGRSRGPIAVNALLALVGVALCAAALRTRARGARPAIALCVVGILATVADAIKIGWIPLG